MKIEGTFYIKAPAPLQAKVVKTHKDGSVEARLVYADDTVIQIRRTKTGTRIQINKKFLYDPESRTVIIDEAFYRGLEGRMGEEENTSDSNPDVY